jgi:2-keto-4-pentenoate hydratase
MEPAVERHEYTEKRIVQMPLTKAEVETLGGILYESERNRVPIAALTDDHAMTVGDAYAVQQVLVDKWLNDGAKVIGWKVGLTSVAMQKLLGVSDPDFGRLLDRFRLEDDYYIRCADFIAPKVEPEIAFILKSDLRGPNVTRDDVLSATEYVLPALELVDSRVRDWKIKLADTIADNASCGRFILGRTPIALGDFDLGLVGMNYYVEGELVSTATGAAVMGNPAESVAWVCNTIAPLGEGLKAGQVVMPGSLVTAIDAKPGLTFTATFDRLGSVTVHMT